MNEIRGTKIILHELKPDDSKITKPVKFSVITGNIIKTLNKIDAISNQHPKNQKATD